MDLEHELRRSLQRLGESIDLPAPGVDAVVRTARRRHRRRQAVGAATTAALAVVTTIGVVRVAGDEDGGDDFRSLDDGPATVAPGPADPLQWSVLDPDGELGFVRASVTGGDGTIYALSTAPGEASFDGSAPQVLWTSIDGQDWAQHEAPADLSISTLSEHDGVLYAIGTAPATATVDGGSFAPVVGTSTDDGANWDVGTLPVQLPTPTQGIATSIGGTSLASGAAGTLAAISTYDHLTGDVADSRYGWEIREDGIALYAPVTDDTACELVAEDWGLAADGTMLDGRAGLMSPQATTTAPAAGPPSTTAPSAPPPSATVLADGRDPAIARDVAAGTFDYESVAVDPDDLASEPRVVCQLPGDDERREYLAPARVGSVVPWSDLGIDPARGAAIADGTAGGQQLFRQTADGFVAVDAPFLADADGLSLIADDDGFLALVTDYVIDGTTVASLWRSPDGTTWESVPVQPVGADGYVAAAGVVGDRVVLVVSQSAVAAAQVVTSTDGVDWTAVRLTDVLGAAPGTAVFPQSAAVGPAGVAVAVSTDRTDGYSDVVLATSPDGIAWATQPLAELVGDANAWTGWMAVTDRVLVDVSVTGDPGTYDDDHHEVLQGLAG
jgi:hypothetical protein